MPHSLRENDEYVREFVRGTHITKVLDVGVGCGTYSDLLKPLGVSLDAIEVWRPYVQEYNLGAKYDNIYVGDVRHMAKSNDWNHSYDLVIFGDVLEHMTLTEAKAVWAWAHRVAVYGMISVPLVHWPQEGTENPYEAHVQEHLSAGEMNVEFGPFTTFKAFGQTGTFIKEF